MSINWIFLIGDEGGDCARSSTDWMWRDNWDIGRVGKGSSSSCSYGRVRGSADPWTLEHGVIIPKKKGLGADLRVVE